MQTVKMRLSRADFSREMEAMRVWLDQNGYSPRRFDCEQSGDSVVISVDFGIDAEGDAFAARFGGGRPTPFALGPAAPAVE
jgi:hypothetical protein